MIINIVVPPKKKQQVKFKETQPPNWLRFIYAPPKIGENGHPPSLDIFPIFQNIILSDSLNNSLTEGSEESQNFPSVDRKQVWEYETGRKIYYFRLVRLG